MCWSSSTAPPPARRCRTSSPARAHRSRSSTSATRRCRPRPTTMAGRSTTYQRSAGAASSSASSAVRAARGACRYPCAVSWRGHRISVVFPTYNERESIRSAILDFASTGVVDEIVVVNNNAAAGTSEEVNAAIEQVPDGTLVREVHEYRQGYGYAIQRGLREAV